MLTNLSLPLTFRHGVQWDKFRAQVQQVMLQRSIGKKYVGPLNEIADDFMDRIHEMRDTNNELPQDFLKELYKWALECEFANKLYTFAYKMCNKNRI